MHEPVFLSPYAYLLLSTTLFVAWLILYGLRPDLLAIAYDEGRLIGVLTWTGGITTIVEDILRASAKDTGACVRWSWDRG